MIYLDWECFDSTLVHERFSIAKEGPLFGPVNSFVIERNKNLQLELKTTSTSDSQTNRTTPKANLVTRVDGEVEFHDEYGASSATASGITYQNHSIKFSQTTSPSSSKEEVSLIKRLKWERLGSTKSAYTIDWIENLSSSFLWPHSEENKELLEKERRFISSNDELLIKTSAPSESFSRTCAQIQVGRYKIIIGKSSIKRKNINNPGFILYIGDPDEDTRRKIRDCLSYLLGDYLVHLGWTSFDTEWKRTCFCAVSAHALYDKAQHISGRPPAPLGQQYEFEINPYIFSHMSSNLFDIYESYHLRNVFWNYWHAIAAPIHMAAAHFGAAIESLQRTYFKNTGKDAQLQIIPDPIVWNDIYEKLCIVINSYDIASADKTILSNKAKLINSAPQSLVSEKFFKNINLEISKLEKRVWSNRNKAAHGAGIKEGDEIKTIRENKVLMVLMNRIVLSLSNSSETYYDYYSLERPTRNIKDGIPDEN